MKALALTALLLATPAISAERASLLKACQTPKGIEFQGGGYGGISGVDHDPRTGLWAFISDDKSEHGPSHAFLGRLDVRPGKPCGPILEAMIPLRREDGSTFPDRKAGTEAADGESIRFDPRNYDLVWATEGDFDHGYPPSVRRMKADGTPVDRHVVPEALTFHGGGRTGARKNATTEGMSWSGDGRSLWLSMEWPLAQDGPIPSVAEGGLTRLTKLDRSGQVLAQYAYRIDPVQVASPVGVGDNGISEILALDAHRLLVLERSGIKGADGRYSYHVRLYVADLAKAQDVSKVQSLSATLVRAADKRLLLNFDSLGVRIDNLEAMAWGPRLEDGARTLVLASDDNYDANQVNQILVLRVGP
ncbi:esterase-like activity of phytase family protein [Caulobacter sp.]|uniref:esterase-like activity of phytase family protein n=1 Tax=Caulobacter sp. TaxID=78 RepID=UPI001B03CA7D|nr:esterase-like activity of phytase family protein [Caulobacter sp.]MBO9545865.1 esterase-like activity of phytase family protein [Caulobacter sp.]